MRFWKVIYRISQASGRWIVRSNSGNPILRPDQKLRLCRGPPVHFPVQNHPVAARRDIARCPGRSSSGLHVPTTERCGNRKREPLICERFIHFSPGTMQWPRSLWRCSLRLQDTSPFSGLPGARMKCGSANPRRPSQMDAIVHQAPLERILMSEMHR